jgi:hypothetical protein
MHGKTKIKIIDAQQAKLHNNYKNTKLKLLKTNAGVWFNKMRRIKQSPTTSTSKLKGINHRTRRPLPMQFDTG